MSNPASVTDPLRGAITSQLREAIAQAARDGADWHGEQAEHYFHRRDWGLAMFHTIEKDRCERDAAHYTADVR